MAYLLSYTKRDDEISKAVNRPRNMSGHIYFSDIYESMHLALSRDGHTYVPLRNDTGILFPKASFCEGKPEGTTKTLRYPWLFERADGTYGVCAVRRNENGPDPLSIGSVMLFYSRDLIRYEEAGFLKVADEEVDSPRCRYEAGREAYYLEYRTAQGIFCGYTADFSAIDEVRKLPAFTMNTASVEAVASERAESSEQVKKNMICQNALEISEEAADRLEMYLGVIRHVSVDPLVCVTDAAGEITEKSVSGLRKKRAVCRYSDGSTHEKDVEWDEMALAAIHFEKPGTYEVPGRICQKHWPFPMMEAKISDPCITRYQGKYYLTSTRDRDVSFRISDTIEGCFRAKLTTVWRLPKEDKQHANIWAQELHIIRDIPYVFTTVASPEWYTVQSHILKCTGNPGDPKAWEEPRLCVKPDGSPLEEHGISLDMTYFCVEDTHYVMWSNRVIHVNEPGYEDPEKDKKRPGKKNGRKKQDIVICEPADICIATINPEAPWQLTSNPVRILRPQYGWDRLQTEVDEGPYLLRRGEDLFVTISGSSTGVADLYCLGLLHARTGSNLLAPESWDWLPYPVLTKESVPGEFGPGHNNFVKDAETGDDLMVYHAVPHDAGGKSLGRHAGVRRVHWAASGYPYLEMTEERDLDPALRDVTMKVVVRG